MKEEIDTSEKPVMALSPNVIESSTEENGVLDNGDVEATDAENGEEFTIEGAAEIGENPLESEYNPLEDPGDLDPFYDEGEAIAVDEDTSGFLEKVNLISTVSKLPIMFDLPSWK